MFKDDYFNQIADELVNKGNELKAAGVPDDQIKAQVQEQLLGYGLSVPEMFKLSKVLTKRLKQGDAKE